VVKIKRILKQIVIAVGTAIGLLAYLLTELGEYTALLKRFFKKEK